MPAERILDGDTLKVGKEKLNKAIEQANKSEVGSAQAITMANGATSIANNAVAKADETQTQLNNVIIESGTSDAEVIQARGSHDLLNNRLESFEKMIYRRFVKNGKLVLPGGFPSLGFEITRLRRRVYQHNATPYNQYDWSNATEIFISGFGLTANIGDTALNPANLIGFRNNLDAGVYGSQKDFILTFLENSYNSSSNFYGGSGVNILFRSGSLSGFTWTGRIKKVGQQISEWVPDSGVFKTTILDTPTHVIEDCVNIVQTDNLGAPRPYIKVPTLAECQTAEGSFYQEGGDVYCNPHSGESIEFVAPLVRQTIMSPENNSNVYMYENMGFLPFTFSFTGSTLESKYYFFGCNFYRGGYQDAFAVSGVYKAFLFDSLSPFASKDGFNYHTTNPESLAVEINCIAFGAGQYKLANGNTTTHSNNGSTAHDGMYMLRVGGKYWDCEGPPVADVNDCYSISIGCEVGNMLPSATGARAGFYLSDEFATGLKPKYVIECLVDGKDITYGIRGTDKTFYMDIEGNNEFDGSVKSIDWEEVV